MKKNQKDPLEKKFDKILRLCKENKEGVNVVALTSEKAVAFGLGPDEFKPYTAIFFSNVSGLNDFNGIVNNSALTSYDETDPTYIAIDNQNFKKPSIYFKNKDQFKKFNHKSELAVNERLLLYWEYGPYSCFTFVTSDPLTSNTIIECIFSENESTQKANRFLFLNLLPPKEREEVAYLFKKSIEDSNMNKED